VKNRQRDDYSFANINMLGKCNANCYFCLGKDIEEQLSRHNQMSTFFGNWKNFHKFLDICLEREIRNVYLTGQNTDPSLYPCLQELIDWIQKLGFNCGIRTNGLKVDENLLEVFKTCKASVGYSIHTLSPITQKMMIGVSRIPDWEYILNNSGSNVRAQVVVTRCNEHEFFDVVKFLSTTPVKYIQARRVSTDTRLKELSPDIAAYERLYTLVSRVFPMTRKFFTDAEEYEIYGKKVVFWRTVKTSVNSMNYFSDGTISDEYFVVEGYLKNQQNI